MKLLALTIGNQQINLPSQIPSFSSSLTLQSIITFALQLLLFAAILLALFFVLFGGLKWILSQGDKKQVEEAQHTITYAIIGLIIALLSFFIVNLIGYTFGVAGPLGGR